MVGVYAPPVLKAPVSASLVLNKDKATQIAETFTWSAADYGFQSATTYVLQFDKKGNSFKNALDVMVTTKPEAAFTVAEFNTKMLTLGLPHSKATQVEARIMATISKFVDTLYSEPVLMTVTPYEVIIIYPTIFVPGSYQAASGYTADWSPDKAPALSSVKSDNKYEGYVYFAAAGMFKFTDEPNWTINWGDDGKDGTLEPNGKDIPIDPGYYKMNVNLNTLTYTTTKTHWGIIGSATAGGWDADQDMTYDMVNKVWTATLNLTAGEIKFRANDDWGLNYGDRDANLTLEEGGDNIKIDTAGSYTVTLDLSKAVYTYSVVKK